MKTRSPLAIHFNIGYPNDLSGYVHHWFYFIKRVKPFQTMNPFFRKYQTTKWTLEIILWSKMVAESLLGQAEYALFTLPAVQALPLKGACESVCGSAWWWRANVLRFLNTSKGGTSLRVWVWNY